MNYPPASPSAPDIDSSDMNFKEINHTCSMIASNNMTFLINSTFSELVRKLIPPIYSDLAIARSLFIFCCSIDNNSLMKETLPKPIEGSPLEHLWSVYCKKSSIASFFAKLCRHTSVPVKV